VDPENQELIMPVSKLDEHAVFAVAVKIPDSEARDAYLSQVCENDTALFDRVSALINSSELNRSFLEGPPPELSPTIASAEASNQEGSRIGP